MAKATSKKQTIIEAAKQAYLKSHTKEQIYVEYDNLHKNYLIAESRLDLVKKNADILNKSATNFRLRLNDANLELAKLRFDLKDATQYGKFFGMLCAALLLALIFTMLIR